MAELTAFPAESKSRDLQFFDYILVKADLVKAVADLLVISPKHLTRLRRAFV
jgi:hypothetical protein